MLSWLLCLHLWWFRIKLNKIDAECSSGCFVCSCDGFLLHSYSKYMENVVLAAASPSVVVSTWILIQNWCQILYWQLCLLLWWFIIKLFFKIDAKCFASSCGGFSLNSCWRLMPNAFLAALSPPCHGFLLNSYSKVMQNALMAALSSTVVVSYLILIKRNAFGHKSAITHFACEFWFSLCQLRTKRTLTATRPLN